MNTGTIKQVIGPVVDIEFASGQLPAMYNALKLTNPAISDDEWNLVVEVASHLGENTVRCISMAIARRWIGSWQSSDLIAWADSGTLQAARGALPQTRPVGTLLKNSRLSYCHSSPAPELLQSTRSTAP